MGGRPCPPLIAAAVQDVRRFYQYRHGWRRFHAVVSFSYC
ncbi:hypothetical protein HMPREF9193_01911 [Treponema lecithinolyticum ATCC 700332]|uniref:Uncharacterized protein n=1 Tax=Treponema lecithinolyticum ATCC 700332 TaxID=1321815 RepID=A0ABN0NWP1_TRELE|nr:hypothetical protein HMPREF9193_01911 [Treponema lecithinolyticum ATCC 700332]